MLQSSPLTDALTIAPDARIMMRWWWFGPAVSREDVTRQLTLMRDAGIGGIEIAYVYPVCLDGESDGVTIHQFLTPPFREVLGFAAKEAARLGMRLDLTLGSGWPFGGPHIASHHAAKQLVLRHIDVPAHATAVPLPPLGEGEALVTAVADDGTPLRVEDSHLSLAAASPAPSRVTLLVMAPTGQQVKRAAVGAEGLVLDHYNESALRVHLDAVGEPLLRAAGPGRVRAVFTDSLEVYGSNWTADFLMEFQRRRGYDLAPHLPTLIEELNRCEQPSPPPIDADRQRLIRDLQHDYAETLTELLHDRFLQPLQRFARKQGVLSRVQAYGVPPATLASYRHVDLPEGETTLGISDIHQPADWTELTPNRFAASASRSKPHNVVSGETWTRLHSPPYAATPLDMKAEADQFFLQGVNQIIGHGWCHRPPHGDPTQWVFYAAGNFNEVNPWHPVMPDLTRYLQTVSSLLRAGEPVADVAIYVPDHDVWAGQTLSSAKDNLHHVDLLREHIGIALPAELLRVGLNFDLVDDVVLLTLAEDEAATPYRMIVLPHVERIPLATLQALEQLARRSVTVVALGRAPDQPTGYAHRQREMNAVAQASRALFEPGAVPHVHCLPDAEAARFADWCPPDVALNQASPQVGYVHRRLGDHDLYFFANARNQPANLEPVYRTPRRYVYRLDPVSRTAWLIKDDRLKLQAFESQVLIRSARPLDRVDLGDFQLRPSPPTVLAEEQDISDDWRMTLPDATPIGEGPLRPWTDSPSLRHHAGTVSYTRTLTVPPQWVDRHVELTFDQPAPITPYRRNPSRRNTGVRTFVEAPVKDAAEVVLNGQRIGALFSPPYRMTLTGLLKPGVNVLEIRVYNRLINTLAAGPLYDFSAVHETWGQRFDWIQDFDAIEVEPAGLRGPIWLRMFE